MVKDNLFEPFEVVLKEPLEVCPRSEHSHSFFEMIYIISGSGKQRVNKSSFSYKQGNLFLLTPEDSHFFEIESTTQFLFIRFNEVYIKSGKMHKETRRQLEYLLRNATHQPGCVIRKESDRTVIKPLMEAIIREQGNHDVYSKQLTGHFLDTIIALVARNIAMTLPDSVNDNTEGKALNILQYIQSNIYHPELLRASRISNHFGISESYLGRYFKKHSNETMQQYITNYKLKLIENRLLHSNMRVIEIANELGFTDESHLIRTFKKYKGVNPTQFKKAQLI